MATTAYHYYKIKDLERMAETLGFHIGSANNAWTNVENELGLMPSGEDLPIYTREAVLVRGTVEELIAWLAGWQKSLEYISVLGACDKKKIQRKEQDYRNKRLAQLIKNGKKTDVPVF